jgi:ribosomal protein S18 acetylase RimI-like enzyme
VTHALDNPAWTALTTMQSHLAVGGDLARRYPEELTSIAAVGRAEHDALDELATLISDGGSTSLPATFDGIVPLLEPPLSLVFTKTLVQMVWERRVAPPPIDAKLCTLGELDREDMVELAALTHPGPFRSHTYRFGTYLGIRVGGVLAAMGGQRMHLPGYRELSAICTHPGFRGHGYARAIVLRLMTITFDEGLTPFLHVEDKNQGAQALYAALGFVERARLPVVVVERTAAPG